MFDAGLNIYKHNNRYWTENNTEYVVKDDNGAYTGLGIGYFRPKTSRGWGHYVSLKLINNSYSATAYSTLTHESTTETLGRGTLIASFGYKF